MNNRHIILSLAIASLANVAFAQEDLTKEITVETDYKPTEQKATKLNKLPAVTKSATKTAALKYSDWAVPTTVNPTTPLMAPYGYNTAYTFSKRRGYFDFSAGSLLNLTGSAGYKILDTELTELNVWLQHNSTWAGRNKSQYLPSELLQAQKQKYNNNIVGLDLSHSFHQGTLHASAFYHYDHFNYYGGYNAITKQTVYTDGTVSESTIYDIDGWDKSEHMQTVNEFQANVGWANKRSDDALQYSANLMFNHFGFSKGLGQTFNDKANSDNHIRLALFGETPHSHSSRVGANVNVDYLGRTCQNFIANGDSKSSTRAVGLVNIAPYFKYENNGFNARLGVNIDLSLSDGTSFRIAPNVDLSYAFTDGFSVYAEAKGGKKLVTLRDMYSYNRYINPTSDFVNFHSPLDAEGGFKIGPFSGFHAKLFGGYGIFKNVNMPDFKYSGTTRTEYLPIDIKGWKAGFELGYKYCSIAEAKVNVTYSPQDEEKGYFMGFDRAKFVGNASVSVTPIKHLKIGIDYQLRCKRWATGNITAENAGVITYSKDCRDLGDWNNLSLGASYQINDMISVFAQGNNLLNKKWDNYYGMSAQQLNVLGGVSIVF